MQIIKSFKNAISECSNLTIFIFQRLQGKEKKIAHLLHMRYHQIRERSSITSLNYEIIVFDDVRVKAEAGVLTIFRAC